MSKNSLANISDFKNDNENDMAWKRVTELLETVLTLIKVQPKALPRTGRLLYRSLNDLFDALMVYDHTRGKK